MRNQGRKLIFSLFHACHKTENIFLYFFTDLKTNQLSYSISSWPVRAHKDYKTSMHKSVDSLKLS